MQIPSHRSTPIPQHHGRRQGLGRLFKKAIFLDAFKKRSKPPIPWIFQEQQKGKRCLQVSAHRTRVNSDAARLHCRIPFVYNPFLQTLSFLEGFFHPAVCKQYCHISASVQRESIFHALLFIILFVCLFVWHRSNSHQKFSANPFPRRYLFVCFSVYSFGSLLQFVVLPSLLFTKKKNLLTAYILLSYYYYCTGTQTEHQSLSANVAVAFKSTAAWGRRISWGNRVLRLKKSVVN